MYHDSVISAFRRKGWEQIGHGGEGRNAVKLKDGRCRLLGREIGYSYDE